MRIQVLNKPVMTRAEFSEFVRELRGDLIEKPDEWENITLENYLEAISAYTNDVQAVYKNLGVDVDADLPTWETFSKILKGASIYE